MLQQYPMDTFVGFQNRQIGYMIDGVFYPTMHPQYEGHHLLQRKKSKPLTIRDPNDCNRDVMAEIFGERLPSPPIPPSVWPQCSNVVEAPVPPDTTPPNEVELSTGPASETCQPRLKLLKRPGLLLFSFPPEEAVQQKKTEKVNRRRRKEQSQTETRSQTNPTEVVTFCIPLMEEEKMEVKKAKIGFGDFLSEHLTPTQHPGGDIVEAPALLKTTPPNDVELSTGPASETCQPRLKLLKRPGLLLFSFPPEEAVQQKKTEKVNRRRRKEQSQTEVHKAEQHVYSSTRSQTNPREVVTFCIPLMEEEKMEVKEAKIGFGDFLSEHLTPTQHPGGDIVEAPALLKTTPPNEVELSTGPASDLFKRPVLPHFSTPPEEVVQQKYNRWGIKKQNQIGMHKTQSHTRLREPFSICVPQTEEEEKGAEKAVGDRLLCDEQKTKQESRDDHVHPSAPVKPAWTPQRSYRQRPRKLTLGDLLSFSLACTSTKRTIIKANTSPENTPSNETLPRKRSKKRIRFCHMPTTEEKQKEEMNKDEQSLNQRSARSE
ncbi:uncharacterized protein LOC113656800 isoform X2 [Tachysurus fulvidraco]|uniref:uncharacterized protein LOC113656800 isoform X2 n=1 Tax=Tachysurus fulvidraco TaxID=1234273 RepID=UPI001FEF08EB|nr:uncharacterized protein LOC113656800 isoform X2 [Tachysurus fulvidraco]